MAARLPVLSCLLLAPLLSSPVFSADVVYKYVDDDGVVGFASDRQQIPEKYQNRVQALDAQTLEPVQHVPPPAPGAQPGTGSAQPSQEAQQAPAFYDPWLQRLSGATITLPSRYQLGVGLTTVLLIVMIVLVMRVSSNPLVKVLGKLGILLLAGGAIYAIYFSGLNERISEVTHEPTRQTVSGKEIVSEVKGKAAEVTQTLGKSIEPVKGVIERTKAATIGEATQAVQQANQANQQLDKNLRDIEASR
ncbi:MAG: hypothetical protein AB1411_00755 [Nitrospirota bacterium]